MATGSVMDPTSWWVYRDSQRSSRLPHFRESTGGKQRSLDVQQCKEPSTQLKIYGWGGIVQRLSLPGARAIGPALLSGPYMWWDNRRGKKRSISADFRHKRSSEVLWLNNSSKPGCMDEHLLGLDMQMGSSAAVSKSGSCCKPEGGSSAESELGVTAKNVSKFCQHGQLVEAVEALELLAEADCSISQSLFYAVLKLCAAKKNLVVGRRVHDLIVKLGYESNAYLGNHILRMYACGGRLQWAMDVFTRVGKPDAFMWFSIISAHAKHGKPNVAIQLYHEMRSSGVKANAHVFVAALQACAFDADLESGRNVHCDILNSGIPPNLFVGNCLVGMYAKCGELEDARQVFDSLASKDVVTWTALIAGYAQKGLNEEGLLLHGQMEDGGLVLADCVTFSCLLKACASAGALQKGRQLHSQIVERGLLESDIQVGTCLVDMYAKCGELQDARRVFDSLATKNVVTWTTLIAGYTNHGLCQEALVLYGQMEQDGLILANHVTFTCLLKACASAGALQEGRRLHAQIVKRGELESDILVGNCLVDMYAKCGELEDARMVFNTLSTKDVVTWNALIDGYGSCDEGHKALSCFEEMLVAGIEPNDTTFVCVLAACGHKGLVNEGWKYFDAMVEQHGIKPTVQHRNCMVDLLGRAGHLDEAENMLLSGDSQTSVVGLTSLLNASKSHGDIERATRCFESLVALFPQGASAYVLMANVYADAGRWADVEKIETQRIIAGARKRPAVAGIEVNEQVHTFVVGEHRDDISLKVECMNVCLKDEGGHVPQTNLVLKPLSEKEKEDALCGHAEKLALAYGLLNTPSGTPLLVTKNLRMCSDCHSSTEIMSRIEKRDIVVRDGYRVHRFAAGYCSCKGRP